VLIKKIFEKAINLANHYSNIIEIQSASERIEAEYIINDILYSEISESNAKLVYY
jgi:hypothetical protein